MTMIRYARLTPTLWSIAGAEGKPVGNVAWPMLEECIRKGEAIYKGADGPEPFAPDYAELRQRYEDGDYDQERKYFIQAFESKYGELCEMNKAHQYGDMIVTVGVEMSRLAATESPEDKERWESHRKELEKLAESWKH